jgi:hypothetical protein
LKPTRRKERTLVASQNRNRSRRSSLVTAPSIATMKARSIPKRRPRFGAPAM